MFRGAGGIGVGKPEPGPVQNGLVRKGNRGALAGRKQKDHHSRKDGEQGPSGTEEPPVLAGVVGDRFDGRHTLRISLYPAGIVNPYFPAMYCRTSCHSNGKVSTCQHGNSFFGKPVAFKLFPLEPESLRREGRLPPGQADSLPR